MEGAYSDQPQRTRKKSLSKRLTSRFFGRSRKRTTRFVIVAANILVLTGVLAVVLSSSSGQTIKRTAAVTTNSEAVVSPLDQLSSADVAVNVARLTNLPEATSVTNNADTINGLLAITPSDQTVVAKPSILATDFKSNKDIRLYVTQAGDSVSSLASKFGVTSDSIINSNGLTSGSLGAGKKLYIPPVNGIVYVVKQGDTPTSLANKFNANAEQIIAYNDAEIGGLRVGERIIIPNGVVHNVTPAATAINFGFTATFAGNGYDYGWCTWYSANRRAQMGKPVPSNLGNAYSWLILAQRAGLPTGSAPRVGAVAVSKYGNHVSVVERVNGDGSFIVSEMNSSGYDSINTIGQPGHQAGGWGRVDYKLFANASSVGFIY